MASADNGAGYIMPGMLQEPREISGLPSGLEVWAKHCKKYYNKWGLSITGFDKKKNLFCLSAIIVAVAMIMMSLLTVQNIIYQNQKEIEGLHQGIFFDITQDSKEKLLANEEVKSVGLSCNIKTVKENSKELSLIYYDDDMLSLILCLIVIQYFPYFFCQKMPLSFL